MRSATSLVTVLVVTVIPATALAQKPPDKPYVLPGAPKPGPSTPAPGTPAPSTPAAQAAALTLVASPNPVVFTRSLTLSGRLTGANPRNGVVVRFEQDTTRPYGDSYRPTGLSATTDKNGSYSFALKPSRNTLYRATAQSSPAVSAARLVKVRPLLGAKASTYRPRAGSRVRFSGIVRPARAGGKLVLQRRSSSGRFITVARRTLAGSGSSYAIRVRVRSSGTYRVKLAGNSQFVNGLSRLVRLTTR